MVTTIASRKGHDVQHAALVGNVARQIRAQSSGQLGQPLVGAASSLPAATATISRTNAPSVRCRVSASQNRYHFTANSLVIDPAALLKPVVHQLPLVAELDQRAIDPQRLARRCARRQCSLIELAQLPAAAGQAGARRMHGLALALRVVIGHVQIDRAAPSLS
jgi:hypothetical protein